MSTTVQSLASDEAKNVAGIISVLAKAANGDTPVDGLKLRDKSSDDFVEFSYANGGVKITTKNGNELKIGNSEPQDLSKLTVKELTIESEGVNSNPRLISTPNGEMRVENAASVSFECPIRIGDSTVSSIEKSVTNVPILGQEDSTAITSRAYVNALYKQSIETINGLPDLEIMNAESKSANVYFDSQGLGYSIIDSSTATICEKRPSNSVSESIFIPRILKISTGLDPQAAGFYLVDKCNCSNENWKNVKLINAPYLTSLLDCSILDSPTIILMPRLTNIAGSFNNWSSVNRKLLVDFSSLITTSMSNSFRFEQIKTLKLNVNFHHADSEKNHMFNDGNIETVRFISNEEGSINTFNGSGKLSLALNEPNVYYPTILRMIDMEDGMTQFALFKDRSLNYQGWVPISNSKIHIY